MKRLFLLSVFLLFGLFACSSNSAPQDNGSGGNESDTQIVLASNTRKIIYKVEANIYSKDIDSIKTAILESLNDDERTDQVSTSDDYIYLKLRIKTDRLDAFIKSLDNAYNLNRYNQTSEDISLNYFDKQGRIDTLNKELTRLNLLYDTASIPDMISINQRVSEIETQLQNLNKEINELDSLINYSEVTLRLYQDKKAPASSFLGKIKDAFLSSIEGLFLFFQYLVIVVIALIPWALIIAPIIYLIIWNNKRLKNKPKK